MMNVAQHVVHPPEHLLAWPTLEHHSSLVFITRGIDPARIAQSLEVFQHAGGQVNLSVMELT